MQESAPESTPRKQCGAKTRSGKPCPTPGMTNGRCRMHGGSTPNGVNSPQFKHGRNSKYLRNLDVIDERVNDPNLVDSRRPIAVQEYVLSKCLELLEQAVDDEQVQRLEAVRDAAEAMSRAQNRYWATALAGKNSIAYSEFIGLLIQLGHILEEVCGAEPARLAMERADKELCNGALRLSG